MPGQKLQGVFPAPLPAEWQPRPCCLWDSNNKPVICITCMLAAYYICHPLAFGFVDLLARAIAEAVEHATTESLRVNAA